MKNITIILRIAILGMLTSSSCRTLKQKTSKQESMIQNQYTGTQSRQASFSHKWDSTGRYWFFSTDSTFYYHPDSGLYAVGGLLSVSENKMQLKIESSLVDSAHVQVTTEEKSSLWKSYYRKVKDSRWTLIVTGVLLLGCAYWWYRYRQRR